MAIAKQNIDLWNSRYASLPGWCSDARIIQGDSQKLCEVVREAGICVSSPPFATAETRDRNAFHSYDANESKNRMKRDYILGDSPGQLVAMPMGDVQTVVSSPPYEASLTGSADRQRGICDTPPPEGAVRKYKRTPCGYEYSPSLNNLGNQSQDTFWAAARQIVSQVYDILPDGGHSVWVVKAFVRKGKLVDFPGQWLALCESVGFGLACRHRALLYEDSEPQLTLDGETKIRRKRHASFFRRLAEQKGSPVIDYEDVLCLYKNIV